MRDIPQPAAQEKRPSIWRVPALGKIKAAEGPKQQLRHIMDPEEVSVHER
jgi:hypothetical protein